MVEDAVADGRRIAELLASELTGREDTGLDRVGVSNVDRSVDPDPSGARAYDVTVDDSPIATALVRPEDVLLTFDSVSADVSALATGRDLPTARAPDDGFAVVVPDGAAVKRAVDLLTTLLDTEGAGENRQF